MNDVTPHPNDEADAHPSDTIRRKMGALLMQGANRFDPVGFRFIESMARRSEHQNAQVKRLLENKLIKALENYQFRFEIARSEAASLVKRLATQYPEAAESLQQRFAEGDFAGIRRCRERLEKSAAGETLSDLTRAMQRNAQDDDDEVDMLAAGASDFDALLRKQEKDALRSSGGAAVNPRQFGELKSMRMFRGAWARLSADKRIAEVIDTAPKDTGPLNSQTLVIRSLTLMRELSPEYANRFVSYVDTLLWLEKAGGKPEPATDKAAGKSRTKPGKGR